MRHRIKFLIFIFLLSAITVNPASAHKLISHDNTHQNFESALFIPDHKISWAIYEDLDMNDAKYYTFDAKKGDLLYAGIVVPKISGLEKYAPTLIFVEAIEENGEMKDFKMKKFPYEGDYPGQEFYEPFGQVTYWERQEVTLEIPSDGTYFLVVVDEKNQAGKYSLAIGTIEDFSGMDFVTILPKAWFDTKIFLNDYFSIVLFFIILFSIVTLPILYVTYKRKKKFTG